MTAYDHPLLSVKYAKKRDDLPVFNEMSDFSNEVNDAVRERFHRERIALLREWHGDEPASGVDIRRFSYQNDGYVGEGLAYVPANLRKAAPLFFYIHGGGWNSLTKECYNYECANIAIEAGCVVCSVDYRLAPEFKFPVYLEDCYAGLLAAVQNAAQYGADPFKLAIGGDSAGGNIAAALALLARERAGPKIALQVLLYPVSGHYLDTVADDDPLLSFILSREQLQNPLVCPGRAQLHNLPSVLLLLGTGDFLLEDNLRYANALRSAGVDVDLQLYQGMPHGFIQMVNEEAADALKTICQKIRSIKL